MAAGISECALGFLVRGWTIGGNDIVIGISSNTETAIYERGKSIGGDHPGVGLGIVSGTLCCGSRCVDGSVVCTLSGSHHVDPGLGTEVTGVPGDETSSSSGNASLKGWGCSGRLSSCGGGVNKGGSPSLGSIVRLCAEEICAIYELLVIAISFGEEVCDCASDFGGCIWGVGIIVTVNWSTIINSCD